MLSSVAQSRKTKFVIFPMQALLYFACSLLVVVLVLTCIDRLFLPDLERREEIGSQPLRDDDTRIFKFITQRNVATSDNPVWRSSNFPVSEDAHGKRRILVIGDSFVWGDGISNLNDLWWRQLQLELEKRGYKNVEVVGAGMCGASTRIEMSWLQKLLKAYKPDLIIMCYITNDPDEGSNISGEGYVKQLKAVEDSDFASTISPLSSAFPHLAYQLKELRKKKLADQLSGPIHGYSYLEWEQKILEGKNFEVYSQTVHQLGEFVRSVGVPFVTVTLPLPMQGHMPNYAPVEKLFANSGVHFVNLLNPMLKWVSDNYSGEVAGSPPRVRLTVSPINGHPGLAANHFYAVQTADLLEKQYSADLGAKAEQPTSAAAGVTSPIDINDWVPPVLGVTKPKPNIFAMYYPAKPEDFLSMPLGRPYIQLNLLHPSSIKEIHLLGKGLSSCSLAVRGEDPAKFAGTIAIHDLGSKKGSTCVFKLPREKWTSSIDELLISAEFSGDDKQILVELVQQ